MSKGTEGSVDAASSKSPSLQEALWNIGRVTQRTAKRGYQRTKAMVKALPGTLNFDILTSRVPKVTKKLNMRRLFRLKHKEELGITADRDHGAESSGSDEDQELAGLSLEQVQERVDAHYFDPTFNPTKTEIDQQKVTYADGLDEVTRELEAIELVVRQREALLHIVNTVLKRRILDNYQVFVEGVCRIREVNDDLLKTSEQCKEGRGRLRSAKDTYINRGLMIAVWKRRADHLTEVARIASAMSQGYSHYRQYNALIDVGSYREAIKLTRAAKIDVTLLMSLAATKDLANQWKQQAVDPENMLAYVDTTVDECIRSKFDPTRYVTAIEAYLILNDKRNGINRVLNAIMQVGEQVIGRSLSVMSVEKDNPDLKAKVAGVPTEVLSTALCQVCGKALDFIALHRRIVLCHEDLLQSITPETVLFDVSVDAAKDVSHGRDEVRVGDWRSSSEDLPRPTPRFAKGH